MAPEVVIEDLESLPTAVVRATTTWREFPSLWPRLSNEVWACLRAGGVNRGCPNLMLYLDDTPRIEIGVWLKVPCELRDPVVASATPAGRIAHAVHIGPYDRMSDAYDAINAECAARGERMTRTHWEVYGPHQDDPGELMTEIFWLLEGPGTE